MHDDLTKDALASLAQRKPENSIAIAVDLANDNVNSICCIALAWISSGNVHGVSYYVKPPSAEFTSRKITPQQVANSPVFADLWDTKIAPLLHEEMLSCYRSETLFKAIKSSYEASRTPFTINDTYIRDLKFLAGTYIPELGNDSFVTIMHHMKISVDLDSSLSRAMACACGIDWLENKYPIGSYGIPLSAIMAGTLQSAVSPPTTDEINSDKSDDKTTEPKKYARILHYVNAFLFPFLIVCMMLTIYYMHRYAKSHQDVVDFSKYSSTETPYQEDTHPSFEADKTYIMVRGTYVILDAKDIPPFLQAAQDQDMYKIRTMVRSGDIIVFATPVRIKIMGDVDEYGFVPVTIQENDYTGKEGYAPAKMITT